MQRILLILFSTVLLAGISGSCSRQSTSPVSRAYHATTAHYNILFNSRENLDKAVEELRQKKETDFYRELSLEGIEFDDKIYLPGQSRSNYLSTAEEKAAKAVQKHSMEIRGSEYNPKMDEAMLLLGMSRYYDQRYIAALDAFNYALDNYYDTDIRGELLLWRAKSLLKLGNIRSARNKLTAIAYDGDTKPDIRAWAYAFIAESYRDNGVNDTVARYLTMGARVAKNKELRHTLAFKAAQVWEQLNRKDSALAMTDLILENKTPEKFILQTQLYRIHLTKEDTTTHEKNIKFLEQHLKNYYFNPYFPDLHYRMAEIMEVREDTAQALAHYTGAARSPVKTLKKLAYENMADIYWDKKDYYTTAKYLDSMLTVMDRDKLEYLLVSQRRRSIDQIVRWEDVIRTNDSILKFIRLDTATQRKKIERHIARLRRQAEEQQTAEENQTGTFYFHNTEQIKKGKEAFKKIWGDRPLEDMWRISRKQILGETDETVTANTTEQTEPDADTLTVEYYLNRLPKTQREIDSIKKLITKAHLVLGINYSNDKFREYELAEQHLKTVLQSRPDDNQKAQAYYLLYKIYTQTHQPEKAQQYANKLLNEFPDSPFAQYILHPESAQANSSKELRKDFNKAYKTYESGDWEKALQLTEKGFEKHREHPDAPKFLLLEGKIKGKLYGIDAYIETLEELTKLYPAGQYTDLAKEQLQDLRFLKSKYSQPKDEHPYYLVFIGRDTTELNNLKNCLQNIFTEENATTKYYFTDRYDGQTVFLVSGNYLSEQSAEYILEKMNEKSCSYPDYFIISREKYINLQLTKGKIPGT